MKRIQWLRTRRPGVRIPYSAPFRHRLSTVAVFYYLLEGCAVSWWVYVLECRDGTLYTGCTDDIPRRLAAHNAGRGAKYTRGRGPVTLRYREETLDKPAALRREAAIKRLSRTGKQALIDVYNKENKDEI